MKRIDKLEHTHNYFGGEVKKCDNSNCLGFISKEIVDKRFTTYLEDTLEKVSGEC